MDKYLPILFFVLLLLGVYAIVGEVRKSKTWSILIWVQAWLLIFYTVLPLILLISAKVRGTHLGQWEGMVLEHPSFVTMQSFWAIALFFASFYLFSFFRLPLPGIKETRIHLNSQDYVPLFKVFIVGAVLFSILSLYIYTNAYGGLKRTLELAPYITSPYQVHKEMMAKYLGPHTLLKRFIPLSIFPLLLVPFFKKKTSWILLLLIPLLVYLYFSILERQRQTTLIVLLIPFLGYMVRSQKFMTPRFWIGFGVLILLFPFITFLNKSYTYDQSGYDKILEMLDYDLLVKEFNFPTLAIYVAQHTVYDKFVFDDFINSFFGNYLPSSWRYHITVNEFNTYYFKGYEDTSVPPGIIANGFYHLGYWGVFIWGALLGLFVRIADSFWQAFIKFDRNFSFAYIYFFAAFFAYVRTGVMGFSLYRPNYVFLILILLMSFKFVFRKTDAIHE